MPITIEPQNHVQNLDYNTTVTEVVPVEIPLFDDDLEIIQKLDDEPNDVGGLTAAELKAKFDEGNLTAQTYINNVLIPQVVADDATEQARQLAESERVANEIIRVANEENRILGETARDTNEMARQLSIAKVQNMTASATTVPYGTPAVATITTDPDTGAFNIGLDIPQGKPGTGNGDMEMAVYDPNGIAAPVAFRPTYSVVTMLAASWVNGAYSFEAQFPHAQYDIEVSVDESATEEQFDAFGEARIGSSATSNIAVARGEIPTVDIPVMVKAVRK